MIPDHFKHISGSKQVTVLGAPLTHGQPISGLEHGPALIREAGLYPEIAELGWRVTRHGDLVFPDTSSSETKRVRGARNSLAVGSACQVLAESVKKERDQGNFCVTLGGDHSIAFGTLAGVLMSNPDTKILWVDAHTDINTPRTSESGNLHGQPVSSFLTNVARDDFFFDYRAIPGFEWMPEIPLLKPENIVYVGLRDVDGGECEILEELDILAFTMHEVDRYGIGPVMDMSLEYLSRDGLDPIHCSFDIDAMDPVHAPATGTTVRGGLTWREGQYIMEAVAQTGLLASVDLVEVNPSLGTTQEEAMMTAEMGKELILSALGRTILPLHQHTAKAALVTQMEGMLERRRQNAVEGLRALESAEERILREHV